MIGDWFPREASSPGKFTTGLPSIAYKAVKYCRGTGIGPKGITWMGVVTGTKDGILTMVPELYFLVVLTLLLPYNGRRL